MADHEETDSLLVSYAASQVKCEACSALNGVHPAAKPGDKVACSSCHASITVPFKAVALVPAQPPAQNVVVVNRNVETKEDHSEDTLWEGTTWPRGLCSKLCCSEIRWHITNKRIDWTSGCCGTEMDSIDLRRVVDLQYQASCTQWCCCRGTILIISGDPLTPKLRITTWGMKEVYLRLREALTKIRQTVAVEGDV